MIFNANDNKRGSIELKHRSRILLSLMLRSIMYKNLFYILHVDFDPPLELIFAGRYPAVEGMVSSAVHLPLGENVDLAR